MNGVDVLEIVFWAIGITFVYAGLAAAATATRPGLHWLVIPAAVPVVMAVASGIFGVVTTPHPLIAIAVGAGLGLTGIVGGNPFVVLLLGTAAGRTGHPRLGAHGGIIVPDTSAAGAMTPGATAPGATAVLPVEREILRGGTTIGYLERFALIGAVLAGQSAAVAVIVAVKGLGRFSELENEQARERFIIGTLASLIWAATCTAAILTLFPAITG